MRMPEAHGAIPFKITGIERVTGVVVNREPMVRVRLASGIEITAPVIPTLNALLDLEHHGDTIGRVIVRECLRGGMPEKQKSPVGSGTL